MRRQEALDFSTHGDVIGARRADERQPLRQLPLERRMKHLFDPRPLLGTDRHVRMDPA
jgi:hypothetical protein